MKAWRALAASPWAYAAVFAGALALSLALAATLHLPVPRTHDEFAYLLQGDTFAHGRLANPTPRGAAHFESFHVLLEPAYAAKYPPAQGLALAFGELLWRPILGVWLSTAFAVTAVAWMLAGFVARRAALVGAGLVAVNPQVLEWSWSFWGGSIALAGGALLFGGLARSRREPRVGAGLALGAGMGLLALSRPFEGAVLSLLALAWLALEWRGRAVRARAVLVRTFVPLVLPLGAALAFQARVNLAVTGDVWTLPYVAYERAHSGTPLFLFQEPAPDPPHASEEVREFYRLQTAAFGFQRTRAGYVYALRSKLTQYAQLVWGGALFVALLLAAPALARRRLARRVGAVLLVFAAVVLLPTTFSIPHYAAPILPLFALLFVLALRRIALASRAQRRLVRGLARAALVAGGLYAVFDFARPLRSTLAPSGWQHERAALAAELEARGGKHLVLVAYAPGHVTHFEWVYNGADLDAAPVVWARDLGPDANAALVDLYPERTVLAITVQ